MSIYHSKSNYHPVSALPGSLPNGSHLLPGNGYYSVEGRVPHQRFDYTTSISDPKMKYSQSWRLDALHSMKNLKKETSLPKYYTYYPHFEATRDRYIFVPKFRPREENERGEHEGLNDLKRLGIDQKEYRMNKITALPAMDTHVLPEATVHNDLYMSYNKPRLPYDMPVLRDTNIYKTPYGRDAMYRDRNFVSATTLVPRP